MYCNSYLVKDVKIDFGSLSKIVVKPLPCRQSASFVKGHDMKKAFTKFCFFLFPVDLMLSLTLLLKACKNI